jgi:hypothetical protein
MRYVLFVLFFSVVSSGMCMEYNLTVENIAFSIPREVSVTVKQPIDFFLMDFLLDNGNIFLKAYIGNHPQSIHRNQRGYEKEVTVMEHQGEHWSYKDSTDGTYSGEVLIRINRLEWPAYIQFWYEAVDDEQFDLIRNIVSKANQGIS